MVIVGHVDSGKSTLIGHLLYLMKILGKHSLDKLQKVNLLFLYSKIFYNFFFYFFIIFFIIFYKKVI